MTPEWRPYSVPTALKNGNRRGARCANASNAGRTDRPTVGRTRQSEIHYSPPRDKKVCRRDEVDTKCYGRKDGRGL